MIVTSPFPDKTALRFLESLAGKSARPRISARSIARCLDADWIEPVAGGGFSLTDAGRGLLARRRHPGGVDGIDPFRAQHLALAGRDIVTASGTERVVVNDSECPLAWLARRGRIGKVQFIAGERLRADFTRGQLTPRVTSNWSAPSGPRGNGNGAAEMTDMIMASRQRVRHALEGVGREFAGLLLDVCCFLRGLEDIERERGWPARSAKVVLQLALDRLARHYGLSEEARGAAEAQIRTWHALDAAFSTEIAD